MTLFLVNYSYWFLPNLHCYASHVESSNSSKLWHPFLLLFFIPAVTHVILIPCCGMAVYFSTYYWWWIWFFTWVGPFVYFFLRNVCPSFGMSVLFIGILVSFNFITFFNWVLEACYLMISASTTMLKILASPYPLYVSPSFF